MTLVDLSPLKAFVRNNAQPHLSDVSFEDHAEEVASTRRRQGSWDNAYEEYTPGGDWPLVSHLAYDHSVPRFRKGDPDWSLLDLPTLAELHELIHEGDHLQEEALKVLGELRVVDEEWAKGLRDDQYMDCDLEVAERLVEDGLVYRHEGRVCLTTLGRSVVVRAVA